MIYIITPIVLTVLLSADPTLSNLEKQDRRFYVGLASDITSYVLWVSQ